MIQRNRKKNRGPFLLVRLDLLRHPKFQELKYSERVIYLELLAEASYKNQNGPPKSGQQFEESYSLLRAHTGANSATIARGLKRLCELGFLKRLNDPDTLWTRGEDAISEFEINLDWLKEAE